MIILMVAGSITGAFAQKGFQAGIKGSINSTWLFNELVSDAGDNLDYASSFGPQFGAQFAYMFDDNAGISLDVLMATVKQNYKFRTSDPILNVSASYEGNDELKAIDLPLLFRYHSDGGLYFEVGPQYSIVNSIESTVDAYTLSAPGISLQFGGGTTEVKSTKNYISAVLGLGYTADLSEKLFLNMGLRFAWGLGDVYDEDKYRNEMNYTPSDPYEPTNVAVGGLHIGVSYRITD